MNYAILLSKPARGSNVRCVRCLRKVRFSYIDTSPALSARRHLRAALRYSACPPHRPSCLDLGCQTHQTWRAPDILGPPPALIGRLFKTFAVNYGCNRERPLAHGTPQGGGGTECEAVRCGRPGCEGVGRLRCDLAPPTGNRPSGLSSSLSRRRASRCRHRRTCCRSGQNQTSADGTLQQAIAHTGLVSFTATQSSTSSVKNLKTIEWA